jgi:hypothetical protein
MSHGESGGAVAGSALADRSPKSQLNPHRQHDVVEHLAVVKQVSSAEAPKKGA